MLRVFFLVGPRFGGCVLLAGAGVLLVFFVYVSVSVLLLWLLLGPQYGFCVFLVGPRLNVEFKCMRNGNGPGRGMRVPDRPLL